MMLDIQVKPKASARRCRSKALTVALLCCAAAAGATAQEFPLPEAAAETDGGQARAPQYSEHPLDEQAA